MKKEFKITEPVIKLHDLINILNKKLNQFNDITSQALPLYFHSSSLEKHNLRKKKLEFIYIARKGQKFDGHTMAEKVLNSGNIFIGEEHSIKTIYSSQAYKILSHKLFFPVLNVEQTLNILLENAFKIQADNFFTIAVTGTNGKTSVTQMTGSLLGELYTEDILKIGTLGVQFGDIILPVSHVTTPDYPSFLGILSAAQNNNVKKIVLEYTSHGLKEKRLGNWQADIAIFTNLTQDHLDYHKTMEDYRSSKQLLFNTYLKENGTAIINTNNDEWENFVFAAKEKQRNLILVGKIQSQDEVFKKYSPYFISISFLEIENCISNLQGVSGVFKLKEERAKFSCPLIGEFQFENILCAAGVGVALKFSLTKICDALGKIQSIPGRLEKVPCPPHKQLPTILVDYAHTPDALEKSILTCKKTLPKNGKLITVFGCGGDRDASKRPLMGKIAFEHSDIVIVTSDNPRTEEPNKIIDAIFQENPESEIHIREWDRKKAIGKAISLASKNDAILIAGKGHEDYQIIGTTKYPFSDVDVVKSFVSSL